jgi:hypothetical protein
VIPEHENVHFKLRHEDILIERTTAPEGCE